MESSENQDRWRFGKGKLQHSQSVEVIVMGSGIFEPRQMLVFGHNRAG